MSTGPEHYKQAETCMESMTKVDDPAVVSLLLKEAHVHAMLAVAAATAEPLIVGPTAKASSAWRKVLS